MNLEPQPTLVKIEASHPDLWRAWERRRLVFNAILVGIVVIIVMMARRNLLFDGRFGLFLITRAVLANVCFCAGPVVDGFLHRMGLGGLISARVLLAGGLIIAIPATALSVMSYNDQIID